MSRKGKLPAQKGGGAFRYPSATPNTACQQRTIDPAAISALEHTLEWSADVWAPVLSRTQ